MGKPSLAAAFIISALAPPAKPWGRLVRYLFFNILINLDNMQKIIQNSKWLFAYF
jgi:hypothetical protein